MRHVRNKKKLSYRGWTVVEGQGKSWHPEVALTLLFLVLSSLSWAGAGGRISGTVRDASGAVVAGAIVKAIEVETGVKQSTSSDSKGAFSFLSVPVGHYQIEIDHPGFKPYRRTDVRIDANRALLIDLFL
ncbi:MAG: carboxypeptidase-like regulatory domain-containing protein [Terriglobales bacterium]